MTTSVMLRQRGAGERAERTTDGQGGWTRIWGPTVSGVACKCDFPSAGSEQAIVESERSKVLGTLYVPEGTDIARDDRWTITGGMLPLTVLVVDVRAPGGRPFTLAGHLECRVEQIQAGT